MNALATGQFLSELRKEKGLTQKELALQLNVTDKAVSRWKTSKGFPDITSLTALSDLFNITINELLAGKRIEQPVPAEAELLVTHVVKENTTVKKKNLVLTVSVIFLVLLFVFCSYFDVFGWLSRRIQGGYTIITVSSDIGVIDASFVTILHEGHLVETQTQGDGIYYPSEYGDYQGTLVLSSETPTLDDMRIHFGFYNPNNWHKLHLHIRIGDHHDQVTVTQTVACLTDNGEVLFAEKSDIYTPHTENYPDVHIGLL